MRKFRLFIIYFPVILIIGQVVCNLVYFISKETYYSWGFYLSLIFGTNLFFAAFLVVFTNVFRFCEVSKWAAWGQLAFAVFYLIRKTDDVNNIIFQIAVGTAAIIWTFRSYMKAFPLCRLSLLKAFIKSLFIKKCDYEKANEHWKEYVIKSYHATKH